MVRVLLLCGSLLSGCSTIPPDESTSIFIGYYNNEVTDVHQSYNYIEGIHDGYHVSGLVTDGQWEEHGRAKVTGGLDAAEAGQLADVGTTVFGIAEGFTEANPIGIATLPAKYALNEYAEESPACKYLKPIISGYGYGFAAANLATLAAGSFTVGSAGAGILVGVAAYHYLPGSDACIGWVGTKVSAEGTQNSFQD